MKYSIFKRLSNQAASSVPNNLRGCDWQLEYDKIFAELIVRECARAADEGMAQVTMRVKWPSYHIKKHFGVEE